MDSGRSKENVLKEKSYKFALRIVKLYKHLSVDAKEYVLSKQILRSGTSVGANVTEANQAQSKADFVHKLAIALKEAVETEYWLMLLRDGEFITAMQAESLLVDCSELTRILTSSIKTAKAGMN
jgi:four helix bundle protein